MALPLTEKLDSISLSRNKQLFKFLCAASFYLRVLLSPVAAVGYVAAAYVAVAGLEFLHHRRSVYRPVAYVVGQGREQKGVFSVGAVDSAQLAQVLAQQRVGLFFRQGLLAAVFLAGKHFMSVAYQRPVSGLVESLVFLYYLHCLLKHIGLRRSLPGGSHKGQGNNDSRYDYNEFPHDSLGYIPVAKGRNAPRHCLSIKAASLIYVHSGKPETPPAALF